MISEQRLGEVAYLVDGVWSWNLSVVEGFGGGPAEVVPEGVA